MSEIFKLFDKLIQFNVNNKDKKIDDMYNKKGEIIVIPRADVPKDDYDDENCDALHEKDVRTLEDLNKKYNLDSITDDDCAKALNNIKAKVDLFDALLNAVQYTFSSDRTKPGILISKLGDNKYYGSVLRFTNGSRNRIVVVKTYGKTKDEVLKSLSDKFLNATQPKQTNPREDLRALLNSK